MKLRKYAVLAVLTVLWGLAPGLPADPIISEFMAANSSTLTDEDGDFEDWIELYNPTTGTVSLDGWYLTDEANDMRKWRFPAVSLAPGQFLVVFASGKDRAVAGSQLHTNFNLERDGEYLALVKDDGFTTVSEFAPSYPPQRTDIPFGVGQNSSNLLSEGAACTYHVPPNNAAEATWFTPSFDDAAWTNGVTGLGFQSLPPPLSRWTFDVDASDSAGTNHGTLMNGASIGASSRVGPGALSLDGTNDYVAIGDPPTLQITGQITIAAWINVNATDGIRNIVAKGHTGSPAGEIFLRINSGNYQVGSWNGANHMASFGGAAADVGTWIHVAGTYDGTNWNLYLDGAVVSSTPDATGAVPVNENWAIGARGTGTERFTSGLIDDVWIYDYALTPQQIALLANGSSFARTDVKSVMQNVNASIWARIPFNVTDPAEFDSLRLRTKYEDGFVAWLNGVPVASSNAPSPVHWNSPALTDRPNNDANVFEETDISSFIGLLNPGPNLLAVQGLNDAATDGDFLILPELSAFQSGSVIGYFADPTPGTANGRVYFGFVADPAFSVERGFYDAPFDLTVACDTEGTTLVYTLDGTAPSLTNGTQIAAPSLLTSPSVTLNISSTTAVRAGAFRNDLIPSTVITHTYLFVEDIIRQDYQATLDAGFPADWNGTTPDYGMDSDVIDTLAPDLFGGVYEATIRNDLKAVPTLSVVMNIDDMFGVNGIYSNPTRRGTAWERPASFELIYPDGTPGFQQNAGIRIQGGAFRQFNLTKKNSLRLLFKGIYGQTKLDYPFFGPDAVDRFDTITLRMNSNDGWQWNAAGDKPQYARDEFGRRTQIAMGQPSSHGNFMHLYINGFYWGLYNPVERPDSSFCASYFGGDKDNWDAINTGGVIEGDWNAWNTTLALGDDVANALTEADRTAAYMRIQGLNPDGSNNPAYDVYLDVDNMIDYMICNFYVGNTDWPHKNYYFARERGPESTGFKFFMWDSEWSIDLRSNVDTDQTGVASGVAQPYDKLKPSLEFRMRFADHVHKHFFNGGALYVDPLNPAWDPANPDHNVPAARYAAIVEELREAVVGESARWGDQHRTLPYTRDAEWQAELDDLLTNWFPRRSAKVLQHFRNAGLYPQLEAPVFSPQHGGLVPPGFDLTITAPIGTVYYTLDGSDPRLIGGAVSPTAKATTGPLTMSHSTFVNARAMDGGNWSALNCAAYTIIGSTVDVTVSEVMYNPPAGSDFEFIELYNPPGNPAAVLGSCVFTNGIDYEIPLGTVVPPGDRLLVVGASSAGNFASFRSHYGLNETVQIVGPYFGNLRNSGERVTLVAPVTGQIVVSFEYSDARGWPVAADGAGHSLVPLNKLDQPPFSLDYGGNWRASARVYGTPGAADPLLRDVVVNEVVANTSVNVGQYTSNDQIEILNTSGAPVSLADWHLSDSDTDLAKWRIGSAVATIPAGGRLLFDEISHFNSPTPGSGFGVSKNGERVYLSYLPVGNPSLHRVADAVRFKGQESGRSLSRYPDGDTYWYATAVSTGAANTPPIPDIVVSEFMFNPPGDQDNEFIELHNPTAAPIALENSAGTWRLDGGVDFMFPTGVTIPAGGYAVVVPFNPTTDATSMTAFRAAYGLGVAEPSLVFGPCVGNLSNKGERIAVERPQAPTGPGDVLSWVIVDEVIYFDRAPWTTLADGTGQSLRRVASDRSGNDPANWVAALPDPGYAASGLSVVLSSTNVVNGGITNLGSVSVTATFSEGVNGFAAGDITVANGTVAPGSFTGTDGDATYSFSINPAGEGLVSVQIAAGVAQATGGGTPNSASPVFAFTFDSLPPFAVPPRDQGAFSQNTLIVFQWDTPTDANGVASILLHVGTAPGLSDVSVVNVTGKTSEWVNVPDQSTIYARLVVTDNAGNVTTTADSDGIHVDTTAAVTRTILPWRLYD